MELSESHIQEIEAVLEELEELDPTELPEPASRLAALLSSVLEEVDEP